MSEVNALTCRVDGCSFNTRGTTGGAGQPICGQGMAAPCLLSFMSTDPEDIDWTEYATYG